MKLKIKKIFEFLKYGKVKWEQPLFGEVTLSYSCSSTPSISCSSVQTSDGSWTFITSEGRSYAYDNVSITGVGTSI